MAETKQVKDLVIPLTEYPHMPYWGRLKDAIAQLIVANQSGHHTILVFDEAYKLVGMLSQKDILQGLVPRFAQHYEEGVPVAWDELLTSGAETRLSRKIDEFMSEATAKLDGQDSVLKAAHIMLEADAFLLPVMQDDKLIGVVRMGELFQEITNAALQS